MSGLGSGRLSISNAIQNNPSQFGQASTGFVYDVILDENHPYAKLKNVGSAYIGAIRFRTRNNFIPDVSQLPIAFPADKNFKNIPVRNELVEIQQIGPNNFVYRRFGHEINPSVSANQYSITNAFPVIKENSNKANDYKEQKATNIPKANVNQDSKYNGFGKYYSIQSNLHKLKLYEGDSLIESRFGQSIRFSAYNNPKNIFSPTIIIRNNESSFNNKKEIISSVEEDVNRDGSVIALTSGQHQLAFQPGSVDDKGKSDFNTKPESFENYPDKLIGDQMLLNSGRIILSAKSGEMIFYSKKNYGFISDGAMSIDNKGGIDISVGDDINIITNGRNINFVTGNGAIFLGDKDREPMVKGQSLVDVLGNLIDAIGAMQFLTPSGPSAPGPVNVADFGAIKSQLNAILSTTTQLS